MPTWFFPHHVYVCAIRDQGFFLDLERNEYLSAPLSELRSLSRCVHGWPPEFGTGEFHEKGSSDESTITDLVRNHILSVKPSRTCKFDSPAALHARRVLREHGATEYPPVFNSHLLKFAKSALIARYFLSMRSLLAMLNRIESRRLKGAVARGFGNLPKMRDLVEIFVRLQPLLPPSRTPCLVNSLTLLEFLAAHGQFPRLLFGVQSHPFAAHCWLQHEDVVLNSTLEQVIQFTPMHGRPA